MNEFLGRSDCLVVAVELVHGFHNEFDILHDLGHRQLQHDAVLPTSVLLDGAIDAHALSSDRLDLADVRIEDHWHLLGHNFPAPFVALIGAQPARGKVCSRSIEVANRIVPHPTNYGYARAPVSERYTRGHANRNATGARA